MKFRLIMLKTELKFAGKTFWYLFFNSSSEPWVTVHQRALCGPLEASGGGQDLARHLISENHCSRERHLHQCHHPSPPDKSPLWLQVKLCQQSHYVIWVKYFQDGRLGENAIGKINNNDNSNNSSKTSCPWEYRSDGSDTFIQSWKVNTALPIL